MAKTIHDTQTEFHPQRRRAAPQRISSIEASRRIDGGARFEKSRSGLGMLFQTLALLLFVFATPAIGLEDQVEPDIEILGCSTGSHWIEAPTEWFSADEPGMCVCDTGWVEQGRDEWKAECAPEGLPPGGWFSPCDANPSLCQSNPPRDDGGGKDEPSQTELCADCSDTFDTCRASAQMEKVQSRWTAWEEAHNYCATHGLDAWNEVNDCLVNPDAAGCYDDGPSWGNNHELDFTFCMASWMDGSDGTSVDIGLSAGPLGIGGEVELQGPTTFSSYNDAIAHRFQKRLSSCKQEYSNCRGQYACHEVTVGADGQEGTSLSQYALASSAGSIYTADDGYELTTHEPRIDGYRVDACRLDGYGCGERAASSFCRVQYGPSSYALSYLTDSNLGDEERTIHVGSRQVCRDGDCDALRDVTCFVDQLSTDFEKPEVDGQRVAYGYSGSTSANAFCDGVLHDPVTAEGWTYAYTLGEELVALDGSRGCSGGYCLALSDVTCSSPRLLDTAVLLSRSFLDDDIDGIPNGYDNCRDVQNGPLAGEDDQADADWDGIGDACDPENASDRNGNGIPDWDETWVSYNWSGFSLFSNTSVWGGTTTAISTNTGVSTAGSTMDPVTDPEPEPEPAPWNADSSFSSGSTGSWGSLSNW